MKAVYYEQFGVLPELRTLPDPTPAPTSVVVKVEATGLCRSDYHGWQGHDPDIHLPHVPGHELAGTIVAVGSEVRNWKPGARVTVPFVGGCGACPECHGGNHQVCATQFQPGFTAWGSFAEYVAIDYADTNLVAIPETIDMATAASLGCRFTTAFRAVVDLGQVKPGEWVAVHGAGGVGLSAIMIANAMGANVIAVDVAEDKLALAREMGACAGVNGSNTDVPQAIHEITKGGAHVSLDALGHPQTCANSILSLKRRGRHVQVGLMAGHANPAIPMGRIIGWELQVFGSHGMQAFRYPDVFALIAAGKLKPQTMIRTHISLAEAPKALAAMGNSPGLGITVIDSF
jgi:alcohol dehydrogenase